MFWKAVLGVAVLGVAVLLGCVGCCFNLAEGAGVPVKMRGEELLMLLQTNYPHLEIGKSLFITTGEYALFSLSEYLRIYKPLVNLPTCRFKASLVVAGEIHEKLDSLAGVGIAMGSPGISPAWFVVLVTPERKIYGLDPLTGNIWILYPPDITMLII